VFAGLDQLNDYTAHQFFDWLGPLWRGEIGELTATHDYTVHYQLADDSWKSAPLTREVYDRIAANIQHNTFMFNDVNEERAHFTLSGNDESHTINTFKRFEIVRRHHADPIDLMMLELDGDDVLDGPAPNAGPGHAIERQGGFMP
jgi:hypothetical protein